MNIIRKLLSSVGGSWRNGWRVIHEPFAGAWQRNIVEDRGTLMTYPTLYACVMRIATDLGKLPFTLQMQGQGGVADEVTRSAYLQVLRHPNHYQTPAQFRESWALSKLTAGNAYSLKRRDARGVVNALYPLDPSRVMPMVSDNGAVFYQLQTDKLNTLPDDYPAERLIVPASEVIHDRCIPIHHPLIGVPPLAAAYWPALKNTKIMRNATDFFANNAQPGGLLTAPAGMTDEDAKAVQRYWDEQFTSQGGQYGKIAVIGADMKFTPFSMKSIDAQMVEQMRYGDEQICHPFGIPLFVVGLGSMPSGMDVDGLYQVYYRNALQTHIEHLESLLDEGLGIRPPMGVVLDLDPLLRMDEAKRANVAATLIKGVATINEVRAKYFGHGPLEGGDTVYMQQQDYPLDQVRLNKIEPPAPPPAPAPAPVEEDEDLTPEQRAYLTVRARAAYEHQTT